jgi:hypothetical protein
MYARLKLPRVTARIEVPQHGRSPMTHHDEYLGPGIIGIPTVGCHDRVRVPDGRDGEVIGFYRDKVEQMLVQFDTGESRRYLRADLLRLGANR